MKPYYEHAGITIYHADCNEILPTLPKMDLVLTDPPYGIGEIMKGGKNTGHWNHLSSGNSWDMKLPELSQTIRAADRLIIWGGNYFVLPPSRCWLAWVKTNSVRTQSDMELAWTNFDMPMRVFKAPTGGAYVRLHPTQKPLQLMGWCLSLSPESKTIIDPFMGSGTTLVAAKERGLPAVGIEIEERYCEIAANRLSQESLCLA